MVKWEYALLIRRRVPDGGQWVISFAWYAPDGTVQDVTMYGTAVISQLNQAGAAGWEMISASEDVNNLQGTTEVHRYHFKRPLD
ncbi:hypothetical protein [Catenuloplanes indicus]|uniref:DUF4177 domain-containing protein n=1 Tax=Catenuloplanes indicus TaxID=137267 RepID=A0AAE4AXT2_9ACTN|nr:hypothetical protein [Catenuloplanes indicus]MDQ0366529.1 hypothetical protein [Catenuloplanes indicus]